MTRRIPVAPIASGPQVDAARVVVLESMLSEAVRQRDELARRVADLQARLDGIEFIDAEDEAFWRGEALEVLAARH